MKKSLILLLLCCLLCGCGEKTAEPTPTPAPTIEGQNVEEGTTALTLRGSATAQELREVLSRCPDIVSVRFEELSCQLEEMRELAADYPAVDFDLPLSLGKTAFRSTDRELDLSEEKLDFAALSALLPLCPKLEKVELGGNVPTADEAKTLRELAGAVLFRYDTELFGQTLSTAVSEIDLSGTELTDTVELERELVRFPRLERLLLHDCGLDNDTLDALNRKYESIRVVWTVQVYNYAVPTDQDYFIQFNGEKKYPVSNNSCYNLRYCTDLVAVDLGHLFAKQEDIEFLRYTPHVRYLIAMDGLYTDISPFGELPELEYLEMFSSQATDLTPLLKCKKLEHLNISRCYRLDGSCIDVLCRMTQLRRLWFIGHYLSSDYGEKLAEALPDTVIQYYPYRNGFAPYSMDFDWRKDESYYAMRDALHMYYMDNLK